MFTRPFQDLVRRFLRGEAGAVAIIVGAMIVVLVGCAALGVDVASLYAAQRKLQGRADLAAVSGVSHLPNADTAAGLTVTGNGLPASSLQSLSYGTYDPDSTVAMASRYTASAQTDEATNAVSVTLQTTAPLYFSRIFTQSNTVALSAKATAARLKAASFTLGSRLLNLDNGALNGLLGAALGTSVNLSLLDYQNLAAANVDLLSFSNALGTRAGVHVDNFQDLLNGTVSYGAVVGALLDTVGVAGAQAPLTTLLNGAGTSTLGIKHLIYPKGDALGLTTGDVLPQISVSALDILVAAADVVTADHQVALAAGVAVPGVTSASADLLIGEPPVSSGYVTIGSPDATVHTAQTRVLLSANLDPTLLSLGTGITPVSVTLPIYLELASATATLKSVICGVTDPSATVASFSTGMTGLDDGSGSGTHLLDLYLGAFDSSLFTNTSQPLSGSDLGYADILDVSLLGLPLVKIQAKSFVAVGASTTSTTSFTLSDLNGNVVKTVTSGNLLSSAVGTLLQNMQVRVDPNSISGLVLGSLLDPLLAILPTLGATLDTAFLTPVDNLIDQLMSTLGIGVGQADLALHGIHCGTPRLIR